ncbi:MAG: signal peptidase II [Bacteroidia bacterium]|nr:signal peptidase II [Bacteroidia bacterium]
MKQARKYFLLALVLIVVDQITKLLVKTQMAYDEEINLIGNVVKLHFIENRGAAFGLTIPRLLSGIGIEMTEETGKLILTLFSIFAVCAIGYVLVRMASHKSPLPYFIAMIFGGAIGNIIDRTFYGLLFAETNNYEGGLFHGRVVDMIYFDLWKGYLPEWLGGGYMSIPIFNVADSCISIGIVVILIFQNRFFKMDEQAQAATTQPAQSPAKSDAADMADTDPALHIITSDSLHDTHDYDGHSGEDSGSDSGSDGGGSDGGGDGGGGD